MYKPPRPLTERPADRGACHIKGGWDAIPQAMHDMVNAGEITSRDLHIFQELRKHWCNRSDWFPSERLLADKLGIARGTVRASYQRLTGHRIIGRDGARVSWSCTPVDGAFRFIRRPVGRSGRQSWLNVQLVIPDYEARTKQPSSQAAASSAAPDQMAAIPASMHDWSPEDYPEAACPDTKSTYFGVRNWSTKDATTGPKKEPQSEPHHYRTELTGSINLKSLPSPAMVAVVCQEESMLAGTEGSTTAGTTAPTAPTLAVPPRATTPVPPAPARPGRAEKKCSTAAARPAPSQRAPAAIHHPEIEARLAEIGVGAIPLVLRTLHAQGRLDLEYVERLIAHVLDANVDSPQGLLVTMVKNGTAPAPQTLAHRADSRDGAGAMDDDAADDDGLAGWHTPGDARIPADNGIRRRPLPPTPNAVQLTVPRAERGPATPTRAVAPAMDTTKDHDAADWQPGSYTPGDTHIPADNGIRRRPLPPTPSAVQLTVPRAERGPAAPTRADTSAIATPTTTQEPHHVIQSQPQPPAVHTDHGIPADNGIRRAHSLQTLAQSILQSLVRDADPSLPTARPPAPMCESCGGTGWLSVYLGPLLSCPDCRGGDLKRVERCWFEGELQRQATEAATFETYHIDAPTEADRQLQQAMLDAAVEMAEHGMGWLTLHGNSRTLRHREGKRLDLRAGGGKSHLAQAIARFRLDAEQPVLYRGSTPEPRKFLS